MPLVGTVSDRLPPENAPVVLFQNTPAQYHSRPDLASAHSAELLPVLLSGETVE